MQTGICSAATVFLLGIHMVENGLFVTVRVTLAPTQMVCECLSVVNVCVCVCVCVCVLCGALILDLNVKL